MLSLSHKQGIPDSLHSRALSFSKSAWTNLEVPFLSQTPPGPAWPCQNKSWPEAVCHETANTSGSGGQRSTTLKSNTLGTTRACRRERTAAFSSALLLLIITFLPQVSAQNKTQEGLISPLRMWMLKRTDEGHHVLFTRIVNLRAWKVSTKGFGCSPPTLP